MSLRKHQKMRKLLLSISACFAIVSAQSQIITVFAENFDSANVTTTTYAANPGLSNPLFANTSTVAFTAPNSAFAQVFLNDTIFLETAAFSTVGRAFARLRFNHICKMWLQHHGRIQISTNNGTTWQNLNASHYRGPSTNFPGNGYFNESSYPVDWQLNTNPSGSFAPPTNAMWKNEVFDITNIAIGPGGAGPGFPQVKIRFATQFTTTFGLTAPGWFIDDIFVDVSDCEIEFPYLNFAHGSTAPFQPIGARFQPTEQVRFGAWDNIAVSLRRLTYRLNGGPWIDTTLVSLGPPPPDTTLYSFTWSGLNIGDTIDWYVTIADTCNNTVRRPDALATPDYYKFWREPSPPARCGLTFPTSFPFLVSTFPWVENFEGPLWVPGTGNGASGGTAHRGNMPIGNPPAGQNYTVAPNLNQIGFGWSVRQGPTPTANTGPSSNYTVGGQKYVFSDASQVNNPTAPQPQLITPCINVPSTGCYGLEFFYHMFGNDINRLRLDIDTGAANNDNPSFENGVFIIIGQQQNSSTAAWQRAFVPLERFAGKTIRLRFFAVRAGNNGPLADMAIDDLRIYQPPQFDAAVSNISAPEDGFCSYTSTAPVTIRIQNLGCSALPNVPLAFSVNGAIQRDTLQGPFPSGGDTTYTFVPTANLSANMTFTIRAWAEGPIDANRSNDTASAITIIHPTALTNFPYLEDFDGAGWAPGNVGGANAVGTFNNTRGWAPVPAGTAQHHFRVGRYLSPTNNTGPRWDYSKDGNYIYATGSIGTTPGGATYESQCLSLAGMANPVIEFAYHMFGTNTGQLRVEVMEPGSKVWTIIPTATLNGPQQTQIAEVWRWRTVPLDQYANQTIRLRIVATKSGTGMAADMAIDNLRLYNRIPQDAGIIDIQRPAFGVETSNAQPMLVVLRNFGTTPLTSVPVSVTITPDCGPQQGVARTATATWTGNLPPGGQVQVQVPQPTAGYPKGSFQVCATTNLAGDNIAFNDEYCWFSAGFEPEQIPYFSNHDPCDEYGYFAGGTGGGNPTLRMWDMGTPPGGAASAPNAWATNLFGNTRPNTQEVLRFPPFNGFDTVRGTEIRIRHKFNFANGDAGVLERLNSGNWSTFGGIGLGDNWYDHPSFGSASAPGIGTPGWVGNTANSYVLSTYPLGVLDRTTADHSFRLRLNTANNSNGSWWNVDDIEVYVPPQNSAAPIQLEPIGYFLLPGVDNTLRVRIQNTGANPIDSLVVQYNINSGPFTPEQLIVFNPPLLRNQTTPWIILNERWVNPQSGGYNICVVTSRPNGKPDDFTPDDTLCINDVVLLQVPLDVNTPYCNDFEDPTAVPWITYNAFVKGGTTNWQEGIPNQPPILPIAGNETAWMTRLTSDYSSRDSSALFTPVFELVPSTVYKMTFQHNFLTEQNHDGGTVEVTFDGGFTWWTVGWPQVPDWFNTSHVTGLEIVRPGWTGNSGGWIPAEMNFMVDSTYAAIFRFRFGSDNTVEDAGWAIDDFCLVVTNDMPQFVVSTKEVDDPSFGIGEITPNPAGFLTTIPYMVRDGGEALITVTNLLGQVIYEGTRRLSAGPGRIELELSSWPTGSYFINIDFKGERHMRKLTVTR
jgi:hypothetical protein